MTPRVERADASPRERVLVVAREIVASEGAEAVTMRRVVKETGFAAPTIRRHYTDPSALLDAVLVDAFERVAAKMQGARGDDLSQGPREVLHAYLDFAAGSPSTFFFMHGLGGVQLPAARRRDAARVAVAVMLDALRQRPSKRGSESAEEFCSHVGVLWAVATGLALTASVQPGGFDRVPAFADLALEPLLRAWDDS